MKLQVGSPALFHGDGQVTQRLNREWAVSVASLSLHEIGGPLQRLRIVTPIKQVENLTDLSFGQLPPLVIAPLIL